MLVDRVFGADLLTMFTVDYELGGSAQAHDHPFEETYFFLAGRGRGRARRRASTRSGRATSCSPGVGSVHGFYNTGHRAGPLDRDAGPAAAGPPRLSLGRRRGRSSRRTTMSDDGAVVVVGGTRAIGLELVRHYADAGREVVLTGQIAENVARRRRPRPAATSAGVTFDLAEPALDRGGARRRRAGRPPGARRDRPRPEHASPTTTSTGRSGSSRSSSSATPRS